MIAAGAEAAANKRSNERMTFLAGIQGQAHQEMCVKDEECSRS